MPVEHDNKNMPDPLDVEKCPACNGLGCVIDNMFGPRVIDCPACIGSGYCVKKKGEKS